VLLVHRGGPIHLGVVAWSQFLVALMLLQRIIQIGWWDVLMILRVLCRKRRVLECRSKKRRMLLMWVYITLVVIAVV
jgi:hypothetical protein